MPSTDLRFWNCSKISQFDKEIINVVLEVIINIVLESNHQHSVRNYLFLQLCFYQDGMLFLTCPFTDHTLKSKLPVSPFGMERRVFNDKGNGMEGCASGTLATLTL